MIIKSVRLSGSFFSAEQLPADDRPKIVFLGRSNVGKSSLLNWLLNRKHLARISRVPGKTVSINYYLLNDAFYFVDCPGYGYARLSQEENRRLRRLLSHFFYQVRNVRLLFLLVDCRRGPGELDREILAEILEKNFSILTLLTKCDKLSFSKAIALVKKLQKTYGLAVIPVSIKHASAKEEIWRCVAEAIKE